jgi:subtilisin family serine protease
MRRRHIVLPFTALASVLAACADTSTAPERALATDAAPLASVSRGEFQAPAKHLVVFQGRAPKDFEQRVAALGGTVTLNHSLGIAVVTGLSDANAPKLRAQTGAAYVEDMPTFQLVDPAAKGQPELTSLTAASTSPTSQANPAGAILFADQWNMRQVNAPAAWAAGRLGDEDVTVAILDTGIDYLLPDLAGRVDLSRSVSFEPVDDFYTSLYFPGRHPSTDLHYHGTNVATQVASNAWAFAGVTSKTTLMSVKVCSVVGGCHGVIEGILYAIDNGADVINMSLGGWFAKSADPGAVSTINTLMNYAKQRGVTIVVAAGNDANDLDRQNNIAIKDAAGNVVDRVHVPSFFATYCDATQVICVAATRDGDVPASYTNYGRSAIDVAAPGGDSGEWVYSLCPQTSLLYNCAGGYYTIGVAGTSQATPHVSGLAALAVEDLGRNPARVKNHIRNTADRIDGGNSAFFGKGRINVGRAVGAN